VIGNVSQVIYNDNGHYQMTTGLPFGSNPAAGSRGYPSWFEMMRVLPSIWSSHSWVWP
jgi:hypothetical protein